MQSDTVNVSARAQTLRRLKSKHHVMQHTRFLFVLYWLIDVQVGSHLTATLREGWSRVMRRSSCLDIPSCSQWPPKCPRRQGVLKQCQVCSTCQCLKEFLENFDEERLPFVCQKSLLHRCEFAVFFHLCHAVGFEIHARIRDWNQASEAQSFEKHHPAFSISNIITSALILSHIPIAENKNPVVLLTHMSWLVWFCPFPTSQTFHLKYRHSQSYTCRFSNLIDGVYFVL